MDVDESMLLVVDFLRRKAFLSVASTLEEELAKRTALPSAVPTRLEELLFKGLAFEQEQATVLVSVNNTSSTNLDAMDGLPPSPRSPSILSGIIPSGNLTSLTEEEGDSETKSDTAQVKVKSRSGVFTRSKHQPGKAILSKSFSGSPFGGFQAPFFRDAEAHSSSYENTLHKARTLLARKAAGDSKPGSLPTVGFSEAVSGRKENRHSREQHDVGLRQSSAIAKSLPLSPIVGNPEVKSSSTEEEDEKGYVAVPSDSSGQNTPSSGSLNNSPGAPMMPQIILRKNPLNPQQRLIQRHIEQQSLIQSQSQPSSENSHTKLDAKFLSQSHPQSQTHSQTQLQLQTQLSQLQTQPQPLQQEQLQKPQISPEQEPHTPDIQQIPQQSQKKLKESSDRVSAEKKETSPPGIPRTPSIPILNTSGDSKKRGSSTPITASTNKPLRASSGPAKPDVPSSPQVPVTLPKPPSTSTLPRVPSNSTLPNLLSSTHTSTTSIHTSTAGPPPGAVREVLEKLSGFSGLPLSPRSISTTTTTTMTTTSPTTKTSTINDEPKIGLSLVQQQNVPDESSTFSSTILASSTASTSPNSSSGSVNTSSPNLSHKIDTTTKPSDTTTTRTNMETTANINPTIVPTLLKSSTTTSSTTITTTITITTTKTISPTTTTAVSIATNNTSTPSTPSKNTPKSQHKYNIFTEKQQLMQRRSSSSSPSPVQLKKKTKKKKLARATSLLTSNDPSDDTPDTSSEDLSTSDDTSEESEQPPQTRARANSETIFQMDEGDASTSPSSTKEKRKKRKLKFTDDHHISFRDVNIVPDPEGRGLEYFNLKIIYHPGRTGFEETRDFPIRARDIIAGRYEVVAYLGSAAFSRAVQCLDRKTGQMVCMKIIKNTKDFFDQCLDEVKLLKYLRANSHLNPSKYHVLRMLDYFYYKEHLFIVCELLRDNLYEFYKKNRDPNGKPTYFTLPRLQAVAKQVLIALKYIHNLGLIHSDLKPENILMRDYTTCQVAVIDFGSSCFTTDVLSTYVQSRSYRAPEVILGLDYDQKIDLWSLGCILPELMTGRVLFQNDSVPTLLARMVSIIGDIDPYMLNTGKYVPKYYAEDFTLYEVGKSGVVELLYPKRSSLESRLKMEKEEPLFIDFLKKLLSINPQHRLTAAQALNHEWIKHKYPEEELKWPGEKNT